MKIIILLMFLNVANAWEIQVEDDQSFLLDSEQSIKEKVYAQKKNHEFEVKNINTDLKLFSYLESVGGTTNITKSYNCALFSQKLKKLIFKDRLCKTISVNEKGKESVKLAKIDVEKNSVIFSFEEVTKTYPLTRP